MNLNTSIEDFPDRWDFKFVSLFKNELVDIVELESAFAIEVCLGAINSHTHTHT